MSPGDPFPQGFEEHDGLRSEFIRDMTLCQLQTRESEGLPLANDRSQIPRTLVRYWHDQRDVPADVQECLETWEPLREAGVEFRMFGDATARRFIADRYGRRELAAFARCRHPAMRSDYLRLCYLLADGGLYVDADDVLLGDGWENAFGSGTLKVQPLGYDLAASAMVPAAELRRIDLPTENRIFYVNNNPIASPAAHAVVRSALARATTRLLGDEQAPEIQSTTGPGNLTAVLARHVNEKRLLGLSAPSDVELLVEWERVAEPRWDLAYRSDERNWRNMGAS